MPKSTRWNRNYSKVSEYYFKWEIDVMRKPEFIYDIEEMNTIVAVPHLQLDGLPIDHTQFYWRS